MAGLIGGGRRLLSGAAAPCASGAMARGAAPGTGPPWAHATPAARHETLARMRIASVSPYEARRQVVPGRTVLQHDAAPRPAPRGSGRRGRSPATCGLAPARRWRPRSPAPRPRRRPGTTRPGIVAAARAARRPPANPRPPPRRPPAPHRPSRASGQGGRRVEVVRERVQHRFATSAPRPDAPPARDRSGPARGAPRPAPRPRNRAPRGTGRAAARAAPPRPARAASASADGQKVAEALRHLLAVHPQHAVMQPDPGEAAAGEGAAALRHLVLVVREDQVAPAAVDVERLAEVAPGHGAALDVPAGTPASPRTLPARQVRAWTASTARNPPGRACTARPRPAPRPATRPD